MKKVKTRIMGVLNRTPDSFSDGGKFMDCDAAIRRVREMAEEGADIIDIGGQSTRPGSTGVSAEEEMERVIPIIRKASAEIDIPISIDTSKHEVALEAIKSGASIVNDITGLRGDAKMAYVISEFDASVCIMHIKGTPKDMQENPVYDGDIMTEIIDYLKRSIDIAKSTGIPEDRIIVDPGIGFGKGVRDNLTIIKRLSELLALGKPILVGPSRKSFIGKVLNRPVHQRLMGTAASCVVAIQNGANIIRVHDVRKMVDVARMADALKQDALKEEMI